MIILWVVLSVLALLVLIILVRTLLFKAPEREQVLEERIETDKDKIVRDMQDMIRCKTVSNRDESLVDRSEFKKFEELIKERFPNVFSNMKFEHVGKTGFLFSLEGEFHDKPSVCMAHYDVVPVESNWSKPAFDGIVEDGCIWGRGTLDTKGTLCGVLEAAEQLFKEGYKPKNDLYFSFSGEEEIDGNTCADIVSYLEQKGVKPAMVLDEGGAVVENAFPGVPFECAMIGTGEKGSVNMDFDISCNGGHASTPPVHTTVGELAKAINAIEANPFKRQLTAPVKEMFDTLGRYSTFAYRMIFANLWIFAPVLDMICKKSGGELNAMLRTTVAVTRARGSKAYNVIPPDAGFGINMRLMGNDTIDSATEYFKKIIGNDKISISLVNGSNASKYSDTNCESWEKLKNVVNRTWPDAIVTPYLMMACSDSRHYCRISDNVYRFSAMKLSKEERGMIHGTDERIPIDTLIKTVEFYIRLLKEL